MRIKSFVRLLEWSVSSSLIGVFCLACIGCNRGPEVAPVKGTIAVQGKPLTHGKVLFEPVGGGVYAVGEINPDSSFVLTTFEEGDGALVGDHIVAITQREDEVEPGQTAYNFGSPPDKPYQVVSGKENAFEINIDTADGWEVRYNR